jgi:hypothetical protein
MLMLWAMHVLQEIGDQLPISCAQAPITSDDYRTTGAR